MHGLADAFAEAPFIENGWGQALRLLADTTGSTFGQLIGIGGPSFIPFNLCTDVDPAILDEFVEIEGGSPERNFRVAASGATLEIIHEGHYAAARHRLKDDVYDDFCHKYDIPHGIQTVLQQGDGMLIGLAVNRSARDGKSSAEQRARFAEAVPHALRAVRTQRAIDGQGAALVAGSMEAIRVAAFVLDGAAIVRALTPAAEAELAGGVLRLRDARLHAARPAEQRLLESALAAALHDPERESALVLHPAAPDAPAMAVAVCPVSLGDGPFCFAPRLLVVIRGRSGPEPSAELLCQAFGLTSGEAAVAVHVVRGMNREAIAVARGVSVGTVHAQLKSIFAKLDVRREVDLALKLAGLMRL